MNPILTPSSSGSPPISGAFSEPGGTLFAGGRTPLEQMVQSNTSLLDLSARVLLLSRYELGERPLERSRFALAALVEEVSQEIEPLLRDKELVLVRHLCDTHLEGDRPALGRLLLNLLDNAVKWSPPGEEIVLESRQGNGTVTVSARDRASDWASIWPSRSPVFAEAGSAAGPPTPDAFSSSICRRERNRDDPDPPDGGPPPDAERAAHLA